MSGGEAKRLQVEWDHHTTIKTGVSVQLWTCVCLANACLHLEDVEPVLAMRRDMESDCFEGIYENLHTLFRKRIESPDS
jgi:hypothetical protein